MISPHTIDTSSAQRAQQHVRDVLAEIADLVTSNRSQAQFYEELLSKLVSVLSAAGGAIWTLAEEGKQLVTHPASQFPLAGLPTDATGMQQHARILGQVLLANETLMLPPSQSGAEDRGANPTAFLLGLTPLGTAAAPQAVLEIFLRPGKSAGMQQSYAKFLARVGQLAGQYFARREVEDLKQREALLLSADELGRAVHHSLDRTETAYALANEALRLIDCDRVSVVVCRGRNTRVEAVSGQDKVEHRALLVRRLNELARRVLATGDALWFDGDTSELPPQIEDALQAYVDQAHVRCLGIVPLVRSRGSSPDTSNRPYAIAPSPEIVGALIVEEFGPGQCDETVRKRSEFVARIGATAVANALTYDRVFLMPLWRTLDKSRWFVEARRLPKTILAALAIAAAIVALCVLPANFQIAASGTLQPSQRQDVFVQEPGVITRVYVDHGARVRAGDKLLQIENRDLEVALAETRGRLASALEQLAATRRAQGESRITADERNRLSGQCAQVEATYNSLSEELSLLQSKREKLLVRSPIDGVAVTWDLKTRLEGRPVDRGQLLLTVADPKRGWELELKVPEAHSGYVARAWNAKPAADRSLDASYILATNPAQSRPATVVELQSTAEVRGEDGNTVLVRAQIEPQALDAAELRPGATVTGKIDCGRRSLGYVWLHDVLAFVRSKILFRI